MRFFDPVIPTEDQKLIQIQSGLQLLPLIPPHPNSNSMRVLSNYILLLSGPEVGMSKINMRIIHFRTIQFTWFIKPFEISHRQQIYTRDHHYNDTVEISGTVEGYYIFTAPLALLWTLLELI